MPMLSLPEGAPPTIRDAFAHIGTVTTPTPLDIKVLVLVEAASQELYRCSAEGSDNPEVIELLHANAREEFLHAERASAALAALNGEVFPAPAAEDNPYLAEGKFPLVELTREGLHKMAEVEFGGDAFYGVWAQNVGNAEAAALFRQNGKEETDHGNRLLKVAELLEA